MAKQEKLKTYLAFKRGETRTHEVVYTHAPPKPDWVLWEPGEDRDATSYEKQPDGALVYNPVPEPEPPYDAKRRQAFNRIDIGDQLDAIYKYAIANGVVPDAAKPPDTPEGWAARVQAVKQQFPKP